MQNQEIGGNKMGSVPWLTTQQLTSLNQTLDYFFKSGQAFTTHILESVGSFPEQPLKLNLERTEEGILITSSVLIPAPKSSNHSISQSLSFRTTIIFGPLHCGNPISNFNQGALREKFRQRPQTRKIIHAKI